MRSRCRHRYVALVVQALLAVTACERVPTDPGGQRRGFREVAALSGGGASLKKLRAVDVTGDGVPDLIATLSGDAGIRVWRNVSSGSFAPPVDLPSGSDLADVDAGDVNGDGTPDLVAVAHFGNSVIVRLGLGAGNFDVPRTYPLRNHGRIVRVRDLDEDGIGDVIALHDGSGQPIVTTVLLGSVDGSLRSHWEAGSVFANARDLAVGDFNGDDLRDLAIASGDDRAALLLYYAQSGGGFGPGTPIPSREPGTPDGIIRTDSGDLDGDGVDDLVSAHYEPSHQIGIWRGHRAGIAAAGQIPVQGAIDIALVDLNRDGAVDGLVTQLDEGAVSILFGRGDGTFRTGPVQVTDPGSSDVACADFNGDGWVDVAVLSVVTNRVRILLQRAAA